MTLNGPRTCTYWAKWPRSLPGSAQTKGGKACLSVIGYERSVFVWIILFVFFFQQSHPLSYCSLVTHKDTQTYTNLLICTDALKTICSRMKGNMSNCVHSGEQLFQKDNISEKNMLWFLKCCVLKNIVRFDILCFLSNVFCVRLFSEMVFCFDPQVLYCIYILFHSLLVVLFCVICFGNVNICFRCQ